MDQQETFEWMRKRIYEELEPEVEVLKQQRDVARAGEARLRDALIQVLGLIDEGWLIRNTLGDSEVGWAMRQLEPVRKLASAKEALSSTADSAKWLEEKLAEAEHKGYERGRANVEEWRQIEDKAEQRGYERGKAELAAERTMRSELMEALKRAIRALNYADTPEARVVHFAEFVTQLNPVLARARAMDQEKP